MTYLHWLALLSAVFVVAERIWPREARPLLRRGIGTDLAYLVFNAHFLGLLAAWLGTPLAARIDPLLPWHDVASNWPAWAQFMVALVAVDLFHWCIHNVLHRVPFLWRFHQVHHSIEQLDWIGSFRFHWTEGLFYKAATYPVLAILGFQSDVLMALAVVSTAIGHFNHSNLAVSLGPLRYVFNSPEMHVWHHAAPKEASICNFGITLSVWDWLFGTAWLPDTPPRRLGLETPIARTFVGQLVHPVRLPSWLPLGLAACRPAPEPPASGACEGLEIVAGVPGSAGSGEDGLAAVDTWLFFPQDLTIGGDGTWWIADYNNHVLREVDRDGVARVVVGSGFPAGGEGGPALAEPLDHPTMALPDPEDGGILWFAATGNHRIGRLDRRASWVDFPYGTGFSGFEGDGGPAEEAWFWRPSSIAFDDLGTMYVSDRMNQVIRAIDADGIVRTVVGTPGVAGYTGDGGPATEALLNAPSQTETDPGNRLDLRDGRLVIADTGNQVVREVNLATGTIDTLAGGFSEPHDVAIGPDGWVYVADSGNACVRAIDPSGEVRTAAGTCGEPGLPADGGLAYPVGVDVDEEGNVWVADRDNHVVVRVCRPEFTQ